MKLFSVCPTCEWSPKPYDGTRQWGDFDKCKKCGEVMDVWTESGVRNEENRRKWGTAQMSPHVDLCPICCGPLHHPHDHQPDNSGLDDGPEIRTSRKKPEPKSKSEATDIRRRAWETRRAKYGQHGHR